MASPPTPPASRSQTSINSTHRQDQSTNRQDISLEALVSHLLAAKRSLSSISTVYRANEIVNSARAALEDSVVLHARTEFLRGGINEQYKLLKKVRNGVENVYNNGQKDFKTVIRTLDAANARLESTMDVLRSTMVEAAFRPAGEGPRSLLDFVDEQGVETMRDGLKELIRESKEAQTDFDSSILSFDDDLRSLRSAMTSIKSSTSPENVLSSPIPEYLHSLEGHAHEMASLLTSLSNHFDLCVNAIRHTEGGYAAVRNAASNPPPGSEPVSVSGVMTTSHDELHDVPISDAERHEMLTILENDAAEVEDVVMELRDRLAEMEDKHSAILSHVASLTARYQEMNSAYALLESVGLRLSRYIIASQDFRARWEDTKLQIHEQMEELEGMRLFYENYLASYDGLILEVYRRRQSEEKAKAIVKKAMESLRRVYEADMREREAFRKDVGDFLPVDLYPGIGREAPRWEFGVVGGGEGDGLGLGMDVLMRDVDHGTPVLERGVVEGSNFRDREREREREKERGRGS
ncbi:Autophagy-related protein 17 [Clarireedia jacksonii]